MLMLEKTLMWIVIIHSDVCFNFLLKTLPSSECYIEDSAKADNPTLIMKGFSKLSVVRLCIGLRYGIN